MYPTAAQEAVLRRHCADARFVWNLALEQADCWRRDRGPTPRYNAQAAQLTEARAGSWLGEGSVTVQQQALRDFDQAMRNWWAGTHRRPRWRKAGQHEGFRQVAVRPEHVQRLNRKWATVHVPKVGPIRFRLSRPVPADAKSYRVTLDRAGRWHVAFAVVPELIEGPQDRSVVGVDRGVKNTLALSTGELLHAPKPDRRVAKALARSRSRTKQSTRSKQRAARLAARDADRRKDFVEKATTDLARQFDVVAIEDLRVKNMTRSAKGTVEKPGRNVAQKRGLNRAIAEQCWGLFQRRMQDKIGDRLVLVPAAYTSQTCSCCGTVDREARENQAYFRCRACGHSEHADVNAARNIQRAGHARRGGGLMLWPVVDPEPQLELVS